MTGPEILFSIRKGLSYIQIKGVIFQIKGILLLKAEQFKPGFI